MSAFHENLERLRKNSSMTPRALSLEVGRSETWYRKMLEKESVPRGDVLQALADALGTTVEQLVSQGEDPHSASARLQSNVATSSAPREVSDPMEIPNFRELPRDIPVFGTASGSVLGGQNGAVQISSDVIEYVRRPPGLFSTKGAYAVYVENESMVPRFHHGELAYVHPTRPARFGDDVILQVQDGPDAELETYIKTLKRRTAEHVLCEQYNPPADVSFPTRSVKLLHKVLTTAELMGL